MPHQQRLGGTSLVRRQPPGQRPGLRLCMWLSLLVNPTCHPPSQWVQDEVVNEKVAPACQHQVSAADLYTALRLAWPQAVYIDIEASPQGGGGAKSCAVRIDGAHYHAKFSCLDSPQAIARFEAEVEHARWAGEQGLGPRLAYGSAVNGVLLTDFDEQPELTASPAAIVERYRRFEAQLNPLHVTPVAAAPDGAAYLDLRRRQLSALIAASAHKQGSGLCPPSPTFRAALETVVQALFEALKQMPLHVAYCHGDPHLGNFLDADAAPMLIDWSSLYLGDPVEDWIYLKQYYRSDTNLASVAASSDHLQGPENERRVALHEALYQVRAYVERSRVRYNHGGCSRWKAQDRALLDVLETVVEQDCLGRG